MGQRVERRGMKGMGKVVGSLLNLQLLLHCCLQPGGKVVSAEGGVTLG